MFPPSCSQGLRNGNKVLFHRWKPRQREKNDSPETTEEIEQSPAHPDPATRTFSRWSRCTSSSWVARCSRREAWASRSACASFWAISSLSRAAFSSAIVICCRRPASSPAQGWREGTDLGRNRTSLWTSRLRPGEPCRQNPRGERAHQVPAGFPWRSSSRPGLQFSHLLPEPTGPAPPPPSLEWHQRDEMSDGEAPTNGEESNPHCGLLTTDHLQMRICRLRGDGQFPKAAQLSTRRLL